MSARVWTREELDRVHPLPDGWRWQTETDYPTAFGEYDDHDGVSGDQAVYVVAGVLCSVCGDYDVPAPADVALAVILASKRLDSREAMAAAVAHEAARLVPATRDQTAHSWAGYGREALTRVAAMLRRGTVQP